MTIDAPNLDALSAEELNAFWQKHQEGRKRKDLFPEGLNGSLSATKNLAAYAINKYTAIKCREVGSIPAALEYEAICDKIYNDLPKWARW